MDLEEYLSSFIYSGHFFTEDGKHLFFKKEEDGRKFLYHLPLDLSSGVELGMARQIFEEDLNLRSFSVFDFDSLNQCVFVCADDNNTENFNIYSLNLTTSKLEPLTQRDYVWSYGLSKDKKLLFYGARAKTESGYLTSFFVKDLNTGDEQFVLNDAESSYKFTWSSVTVSEDKRSVFLSLDKESSRTSAQIAEIDLKSKQIRFLLPDYATSSSTTSFVGFSKSDSNRGYIVSEFEGFLNAYELNLSSRELRPITKNTSMVSEGLVVDCDMQKVFSLLRGTNGKRSFEVFDIANPHFESEWKTSLDEKYCLVKSFKGSSVLLFSCTSVVEPRAYVFADYSRKQGLQWLRQEVLTYLPASLRNFNQCSVEKGDYESFDGLKIPYYLMIPKTAKIKGALIVAFYGGDPFFDPELLYFVANGFVVLSPSVRGSWGQGKEWESLIIGDLGGKEILDVKWGALYLEKKFGLTPQQIGLTGGSHGGYSVLRAFTMPDFIHDVPSTYPYGFGLCWAGFADLIEFYHSSNIPDWLVYMLGPFEENQQKYFDRSPVNAISRLRSPVMIVHGGQDQRVPNSTMTKFIEKLKDSEVKHELLSQSGLGHGSGNVQQRAEMLSRQLAFIHRQLEDS